VLWWPPHCCVGLAVSAKPTDQVSEHRYVGLVPVKRAGTIVVAVALAVGCGGGGGGSTGPSSVRGHVTAGPTCPVQRRDHPCADKPLEVTVRLSRADGSEAVRTRSGRDGRFSIRVAPGHYRLEVVAGGARPRCPRVSLQVVSGVTARADLRCDTGIR
jgi:hypothetical protein